MRAMSYRSYRLRTPGRNDGTARKVYEGERTNIKITTALDLLIAEAIVRDQGPGVRG